MPIIFTEWVEKGIMQISDLIENNRIMNYDQITQIFGRLNVMQYNQLISAVPKEWKKMIENITPNILNQTIEELPNQEIINLPNTSAIYKRLNKNVEIIDVLLKKWIILFPQIERKQLLKITRLKIANIGKYDSFHICMVHRAILLNDRLYHMKIRESKLCDLCELEVEDYKHFFYECRETRKIWDRVLNHPKVLATWPQFKLYQIDLQQFLFSQIYVWNRLYEPANVNFQAKAIRKKVYERKLKTN